MSNTENKFKVLIEKTQFKKFKKQMATVFNDPVELEIAAAKLTLSLHDTNHKKYAPTFLEMFDSNKNNTYTIGSHDYVIKLINNKVKVVELGKSMDLLDVLQRD